MFLINIVLLKTLIRGGSNDYPQSIGSKIKKNVFSCRPQFYHIKVGNMEVYMSRTCFPDVVFIKQIYIRITCTRDIKQR